LNPDKEIDMDSAVFYASRNGNTRAVAETIATVLGARGTVQLLTVGQTLRPVGSLDLLVIGGPTEEHGITEPVVTFLNQLAPDALRGLRVAAFDTRLRWPRWLSGSAASVVTAYLTKVGAQIVAPAESFIVDMQPTLEPGEPHRAAVWAASLADRVEANAAVLRDQRGVA
jgi:flavodoxin